MSRLASFLAWLEPSQLGSRQASSLGALIMAIHTWTLKNVKPEVLIQSSKQFCFFDLFSDVSLSIEHLRKKKKGPLCLCNGLKEQQKKKDSALNFRNGLTKCKLVS
jgi:hypothetical protein